MRVGYLSIVTKEERTALLKQVTGTLLVETVGGFNFSYSFPLCLRHHRQRTEVRPYFLSGIHR